MTDDTLYTFYKTYGNNILFKYRKNGKSYSKRIDFYKPSIYIRDNSGEVESIYGYKLKHKQFESIRDARAFTNSMKDMGNFTIEGNSNYANQFLIELYQGKMPKFDPKEIRVCILDIEVVAPVFPEPADAAWPITAITFYDSYTDKYYVFCLKDYTHDKDHPLLGKLNVEFRHCSDELDLLNSMLRHFNEFQYDLVSGWNSELFDIPYIVNRCYKLIGEKLTKKMLSPFDHIEMREIPNQYGKPKIAASITGLPHIDYMALYMKHIHTPRESYKLGFIANAEVETGKISYEEEGDLTGLYEVNPQKYVEYNINDVHLIKLLDDKLGLFNITYTLAYYSLSNYEDTLGTTKLWEQLIAKHLYNKNQVPIFRREHQEGREFDGAFVHPTAVGRHEWVVAFDLNSLYPMNEIQYNIGPETLIPVDELPDELRMLKAKYTLDDLVYGRVDLSVLKKYDVIMSGSFSFYRKDKISFMAEIKDDLYTGRKTFKKQMLKAQSNVQMLKEEARKRGLIKDV